MARKIRVFHVEDYTIIRDGLRFMLGTDDGIEYVGGLADPEEFIEIARTQQVDVLILDLYLDGMEDLQKVNGFQVCQWLAEHKPEIRVIAHSAYNDADRITRILRAGARGFVSKKSEFTELLEAIYVVMRGDVYISRDVAARLKNLSRFLLGIEGNLKSRDEIFSLREMEVAELLAAGRSSKEIGEELSITERTVETHRKNMLEKAHAKNTVELVAYMASRGLLKK